MWPQICYPKRTDKPLYHGLVTQLESLHIPFVDADQVLDGPLASKCDVVMDAMFGFGFKGPPRPPFDAILDRLRCAPLTCTGWHMTACTSQRIPYCKMSFPGTLKTTLRRHVQVPLHRELKPHLLHSSNLASQSACPAPEAGRQHADLPPSLPCWWP